MPPARSRNHRPGGVAFLLAQVGQHAAEMFAERIAPEGLTPAQAGILGAISAEPGQSQRALSKHFGLLPSRMVAYLDDLEERGYVERRRSPTDRRLHALHLTPAGEELMARLARLARAHDQLLSAALTPQQRAALQESLAIIAEQHDLTPGVHPGYRHLQAPRQK